MRCSDASTHQRRGRTQQRHSLALHVRAHEGAVGVVVLEERNERRCRRKPSDAGRRPCNRRTRATSSGSPNSPAAFFVRHKTGRLDLAVLVEVPVLARLGVEQVVGLGDGEVLFLIGGQVVDLVSHLAVDHAAVGRLDEAVGVDAAVGGQRADKADVGPSGVSMGHMRP